MFFHIAGTRQNLMAQAGNSLVRITYPGFGYRHEPGAGNPFAQHPAGFVSDVSSPFNVHDHVGAMMLHGLESPDELTELFPFFGIAHAHVEDELSAPDHFGTLGDGRLLQKPFQNAPPPVQAAQNPSPCGR